MTPRERSQIGWIAGTLRERDLAVEILSRDTDPEPRDELGIAPLRDALAQAFFPGITTQQTRAKYFLFAPAMCSRMENQRSRRHPRDRIHHLEETLLKALREGGDWSGVIGSRHWRVPERMATAIYWTGLSEWGIKRDPISLPRYYQWVAGGRKTGSRALSEEQADTDAGLWDPGALRFEDALDAPDLGLSPAQGRFLRKRILAVKERGRRPLIKDVLLQAVAGKRLGPTFWSLPAVRGRSVDLAQEALDAGNLSIALDGAMRAYSFCCARRLERAGWMKDWADDYSTWAEAHPGALWRDWDLEAALSRFARLPRGGHGVGHAGDFLRGLVAAFQAAPGKNGLPKPLLDVVTRREREVKGRRARLADGPALADWNGESGAGTGLMQYRWGQARGIIREVAGAVR